MPTIVKVQVPVAGVGFLREAEGPALIYAKGGRNQQHVEVTDELRGKMAGKLKAFFFAEQGPAPELEWILERPAPWQGW
jgi:hypothetical protein